MYKTINGYTKASMIGKIRAGNNGARAVNEYDYCSYLAQDGNKCAVGCFIPDGHEAQKRGLASTDLVVAYPELKDWMPLGPRGLRDMQIIHDTYYGQEDLRDVLEKWINENVEDPV